MPIFAKRAADDLTCLVKCLMRCLPVHGTQDKKAAASARKEHDAARHLERGIYHMDVQVQQQLHDASLAIFAMGL